MRKIGKRGNGEGSIFQRKDGRYVAACTIDGKQRLKYAKTRTQANKLLTEMVSSVHKGLPVPVGNQTVATYLTQWLHDVARRDVKQSTYVIYDQLLNSHAIPVIGKHALTKLSPQHVQTLYAAKLDAGLAPQTVLNLHRVLHRALKTALDWNLVSLDVCERVKPPRVTRKAIQPLSADQARALLCTAQGNPLEALYVLAITTGMRQGEILGLKWSDVNLDAATLDVRRSVRRLGKRATTSGWHEDTPKSEQSSRRLTLTPEAIDSLKRHRERQTFDRKRAASLWQDRDLVFTNNVGGYIEAGNLLRRSYQPLLEAAGLPRTTRFHDLRHSTASLMLELGEDLKVIQEQLGHADISTTANIYAHLSDKRKRDAALNLGRLLAVPQSG